MTAVQADDGAHMAAHITRQTSVPLWMHIERAYFLAYFEQGGLSDGALGGGARFQGFVHGVKRKHFVDFGRGRD